MGLCRGPRSDGRVPLLAAAKGRSPGAKLSGLAGARSRPGKLFSEFLKDFRFWSVCTVEAMILKTKTATLGAPGRPRSEVNLRKVLCQNDTQRGPKLTASNAATGLHPWLHHCAHDFSCG